MEALSPTDTPFVWSYSLACMSDSVDMLAVTHADQLVRLKNWNVCMGYKGAETTGKLRPTAEALSKIKPDYDVVPSGELIDCISQTLSVPVGIVAVRRARAVVDPG